MASDRGRAIGVPWQAPAAAAMGDSFGEALQRAREWRPFILLSDAAVVPQMGAFVDDRRPRVSQ